MKLVSAPHALQSVRSGGAYQYTGKQFVFCPWCANRLVEKCDSCGAMLMPGEQAEGHYFYGGCPRQTHHRPQPVVPKVETNGCRVCGTPTFGMYCAEHTKGGK